ncbi:MAG: nucleotidyltransferase [Saprospiraceae bacterium]
MGNIFNRDFQDFIQALNQASVKYVLVGGYAVILHGYNRTTGDLDIWVERTKSNYQKLSIAFSTFGMPLFDMSLFNFLENKEMDVFTFGRPPVSIDIMISVKGLYFDEIYDRAENIIIEGLEVKLISRSDLIKAKKESGRHKDLDDLDQLEQ